MTHSMNKIHLVLLSGLLLLMSSILFAEEAKKESSLEVIPCSLVTRADPPMRWVNINWKSDRSFSSVTVRIQQDKKVLCETVWNNIVTGKNERSVYVPYSKETQATTWQIIDSKGKILTEKNVTITPPRNWTLYIVSSTHTDIGLHNSQYFQRKMTVGYLDKVRKLVEETSDRPDNSRYRYMIEGAWVWGNYAVDRSEKQARNFVRDLVKTGRVTIGATCAGNHTQTYGFEELCRSIYTRRELLQRWGVNAETMVMSDNNGIIWSIVAPYAEAGVRNILFSPNQWNPIDSTIFTMDKSVPGSRWNPDAGGGGSRVDVRWDSPLPMLFYWQGADEKSRVLVWCSTQYNSGGWAFGIPGEKKPELEKVPPLMAKQLVKMEKRYPYDVWLFCRYYDDEVPGTRNADLAQSWNEKWLMPNFRTVGDLAEPFDHVRQNFDSKIPVLRGDITCSWAQHPIAAAELLGQKRLADTALPTAEKLASLAAMIDPSYIYPATEFRRAWWALICNDEHSYGTSGYQGRRVYETWLQHRDWIEKAESTASRETERAGKLLAGKINSQQESILFFNPTLIPRKEIAHVMRDDGKGGVKVRTPEVPPFGYVTVPVKKLDRIELLPNEQPVRPLEIQNKYYRILFADNGSIKSIFDKELKRELIDQKAPFQANQFVYTKDNHKTFVSPEKAKFHLIRDTASVTVRVEMDDPVSEARIVQEVSLPNDEKRIDIDNRLEHVRDLFNTDRYKRYGYYAFPFDVPKGQFYAQLNGCVARPKRDVTGHGNDAYLAARDWAASENGQFGIALIQRESSLIEFGHIHPDKTDFGRPYESPSRMYSALFNDWLQMHVPDGNALNYRFRYVITSYSGTYQKAGISRLAERVNTPLVDFPVSVQKGPLPLTKSFLTIENPNVSLLAFKASETPGAGFIARLHETDGQKTDHVHLAWNLGKDYCYELCNIMEQSQKPLGKPEISMGLYDYKTLRLTCPASTKPAVKTAIPTLQLDKATDRFIQLCWNAIDSATQYELFSGEDADFMPDEYHRLATITGTTYTDDYLGPACKRFYRIAAVDESRRLGPFSAVLETSTLASGPSAPGPIGLVDTGLVTSPRAVHGEKNGQLYLEWGQNRESDLSHYELYRNDSPFYTPEEKKKIGDVGSNPTGESIADILNEKMKVADVPPGEYAVALYIDLGLENSKRYYYRVRAVDKDGNKGPFSKVFSAQTRKPNTK